MKKKNEVCCPYKSLENVMDYINGLLADKEDHEECIEIINERLQNLCNALEDIVKIIKHIG